MQGQKQEGEGNEDIIDGTYIDADTEGYDYEDPEE